MAKILNFRPVELRREAGAPAARPTAQVIVFPGVRYEHWETNDAAAPASATRKRDRGPARDVLELVE